MDSNQHDNQAYTVSAVIPAYNIGKLVGRAIDSVLAQTHRADEIIVVDDGSTDDTADIIKSYGSKVIYIYQENLGLAGARNTGIKAATSQWIALLDGDDEWLPDNLKLHLEVLRRNPNLVWSMGNCQYCLYNENRQSPYLDPDIARKYLKGTDHFDDFFEAFRLDVRGNSDTMIIKRQVLLELGLFQEGLRFAEDWDMWMRIAYAYPKIGYIAEPIAKYYLDRPGSLMGSTPNREKIMTNCKLIDRHLELASEHGKNKEFQKCAESMLRLWIRGMLFHNLPNDIRGILGRYDRLFPQYYKVLIRLLIMFPKTTAKTCRLISCVIRRFDLRRRVVRRPQP